MKTKAYLKVSFREIHCRYQIDSSGKNLGAGAAVWFDEGAAQARG
jgi:hypothetical protein